MNVPFDENNHFAIDLRAEHEHWLRQFGDKFLAAWARNRRSDPESAYAEAAVRRFLDSTGLIIAPSEGTFVGSGGPDFRCERDGRAFCVEVACIAYESAVKRAGGPFKYGDVYAVPTFPMTKAVFQKCVLKAPQCNNASEPTLLAIGTWPWELAEAPLECQVEAILTGVPSITWPVDTQSSSGLLEVELVTSFGLSAFARISGDVREAARSSISGVLVFGRNFQGCSGAIHPHAARPFDRSLLPHVAFCEAIFDDQSGTVRTRWSHPHDQ